MEVALVGNTTKGAKIAALLMAAGGFTLNDVLNPPPFLPSIEDVPERRLKKKARRELKHSLMNLYVARRRQEDNIRRSTAANEFKTLWSIARSRTK